MAPKVKRKTRKASGDLGGPSELPDIGALPTGKDIISAVEAELDKKDSSGHTKHRAVFETEAYQAVKTALIKKYMDVNPKLSLIPEKKIVEKIQRLHQTSKKSKRANYKSQGKDARWFNERLPRLFDVIACKRYC